MRSFLSFFRKYRFYGEQHQKNVWNVSVH